MKIPFFDYPQLYLKDKERLHNILEEVGSRGAFIMQNDLLDFEKSLATFSNSRFALGVANGTDALELGLACVNLKQGDEVIISSHTMIATASAIITAGGKPVPVDIGWDNLIDPDAISSAITPNTVGIMPTHLNGRTCNMDPILKIADKHNLFIMEDAAQALGSTFKGQHAGTFGLASGISFFPAKVLGCLGDGGGVLTQDENIYNKIYQMRDHGRDQKGEIKCWGRNSRLDNLQAAILFDKLKEYKSDVVRRRRFIASQYNDLLSGIEELSLPPAPDSNIDHFDVYQNYEITAENRDALKEFLSANGIGTLVQWGGKAVHQFNFHKWDTELPKTNEFFRKCIMLPMNMFISDSDIEYICEKITSFYRS